MFGIAVLDPAVQGWLDDELWDGMKQAIEIRRREAAKQSRGVT